MEIYEEYHKLLKEYKEANRNYDKILERKAKAYFSTQPGAIDTTKDNVQGGEKSNPIEKFMEQLEKIDVDLQNARNDRDMKNYFLKKKELELEQSKETLDKVYYYKFVKKLKVKYIAPKLNYSKMQIYRYLDEIEKMLQNVTKQGL